MTTPSDKLDRASRVVPMNLTREMASEITGWPLDMVDDRIMAAAQSKWDAILALAALPEIGRRDVIVEFQSARNNALEEAARHVEGWEYPILAAEIRAMKDHAPTTLSARPQREAHDLLRNVALALEACTGPADCCGMVDKGREGWPLKDELRRRITEFLRAPRSTTQPRPKLTRRWAGSYDSWEYVGEDGNVVPFEEIDKLLGALSATQPLKNEG